MLKIDHLTKKYKNFSLDCTMEIRPGQVTGLIGKNGAGKSTTFKSILGLVRPDAGSIELLGKPVQTLTKKDRKQIGVVLSDSGFSSYLTIKDIAAVLANMYEKFDKKEFMNRCSNSEMPLDKKIKEFSTGMKAKLKTLVAVSHDADFLILDEPTVGLDVTARDEILDMLRDYMDEKENRAILISSHISSDLETLCDDLYMIDHGQILLHEDTDVLLSDYAVLKLSEEQFAAMDKKYFLRKKRESYGYACLTDHKRYYTDNYPQIVIEKGGIDELIVMMAGGEEI